MCDQAQPQNIVKFTPLVLALKFLWVLDNLIPLNFCNNIWVGLFPISGWREHV